MPPAAHTGSDSGPRTPIALKLLVVLVVVAVLLLGIWASGAQITNDFAASMFLTIAWMAVAGVACLAIALRRRDLRLPVLGAYLVTAAAAGVYLGSSTLFDDEVDENVVAATATASDQDAARGAQGAGGGAKPRNLLVMTGEFESLAHPASGTASVIRRAAGGHVLTLTEFEVDNGPDLRVYLVAGDAREESEVDDFEDLGALKGNKGNQQYKLRTGVDLQRYSTVVIWCRAFSVAFARAPLQRV